MGGGYEKSRHCVTTRRDHVTGLKCYKAAHAVSKQRIRHAGPGRNDIRDLTSNIFDRIKQGLAESAAMARILDSANLDVGRQ